jgi:hypothetical protein
MRPSPESNPKEPSGDCKSNHGEDCQGKRWVREVYDRLQNDENGDRKNQSQHPHKAANDDEANRKEAEGRTAYKYLLHYQHKSG